MLVQWFTNLLFILVMFLSSLFPIPLAEPISPVDDHRLIGRPNIATSTYFGIENIKKGDIIRVNTVAKRYDKYKVLDITVTDNSAELKKRKKKRKHNAIYISTWGTREDGMTKFNDYLKTKDKTILIEDFLD
jgi:hypothetical protein